MFYFLSLDNKKVVFKLSKDNVIIKEFPGTVKGAVELNDYIISNRFERIQMSSDLNHPSEFEKFEKHSIDIAAGYYSEAISAGVLTVTGECHG